MKYTATTTECHSPKTPELVFFYPWDVLYGRMEETNLKRPCGHCDKNSDSGVSNSDRSSSSSYEVARDCPNSYDDVTTNRPQRRCRPPPVYAELMSKKRLYNDTRYEKKSRRTGIYVPRIVCACLVLFILCLTASTFALMFVLWGKYNDLKQEIQSVHVTQALPQQDPQVCLPCSELMQGPFDEDNVELRDLLHRWENGTEDCCARGSSQVATLLKLFAKRKQLEKCALDKINGDGTQCNSTSVNKPAVPASAVSAHLLLSSHPDSLANNEEQPIKHWSSEEPGAHLQGIQLSEHRLVVPETGVYFLYSQAGFLVYYDKGNSSQASQSIFHKVFRYQVIYPKDGSQELLRSAITQCWEPEKRYSRYTSYVGASVQLNKNDQIYVTVSSGSLSRESTYFGLYRII